MRKTMFLLLTLAMLLVLAPVMAGDAKAANVNTWSDLYNALQAGGSITLTGNVTYGAGDQTLVVPPGKTVTLDLNGKTIDRGLTEATPNGFVIKVNGGSLTLNDNSAGKTGKITGGYNSLWGSGVTVYSGSFTMNGGTITNNSGYYGSGVYVKNGCTFRMTGGTITGNNANSNANSHGGGVHLGENATLEVSGGPVIFGNSSENVYCYASSCKIKVIGDMTDAARVSVTPYIPLAYHLDNSGNHAVPASAFFTDANSTVTFNKNGADNFMTSQSVPNNTATALNANTLTRTGYTFSGWNTLQSPTTSNPGTAYANGASITLYASTTLYAQWTVAPLAGTVSISGTPRYGETLTASLVDGNNTGTLTYAWKSGGAAVGTDSSTYVPAVSDLGKTITCTVTSDVQTGSGIVSAPTAAVDRAPVTVRADDIQITEGGAEPTLTATVTGLLGSDIVDYTLTRSPGSAAGTYVITPAGDAEQGGYAVTYETGTLTINPTPPSPASSGGSIITPPFKQKFESPLVFDGGKVYISPTEAGISDVVTLTVTPDEGMRLVSLTVDRIGGDPVELTDKGNGVYTFEMPGWRIAVDAKFEPVPAEQSAARPSPETAQVQPAPADKPLPPGNLPGVVLSPQTVAVNGEAVKVEAYNIGGTNHFMLRDLAALLRGTPAQFDVGFDTSRDAVVVTTGEAYAGEVNADFSDRSRRVVNSYQSVELNGKAVRLTAYNIGGNNFFGLRELATYLGYSVDYDEATNTAIIESR